MSHPFLKAIKERPLLVDGAMGSLLYARGASPEATFESLNLSKQDMIQQVHIDYINAGADVIETNSFSANRIRLAQYGLENEVWKLNVWAAKIARNAREVAGQPVFVAGSIGPTGKLLSPLGELTEAEMTRTFQEQVEALLAGGVDLFTIETMSSLDELIIAVRVARAASKLPIVAQLSFSTEGHTLFGTTPEDAIRIVDELGEDMPDVFGINCGAGPGPNFDSLLRLTEAMKSLNISSDRVTFSCLPNAGQPSLSGGRFQYNSRPQYCASYVEPYIRAGARLVGGCCGTTPEHIKAMRKQLDSYIQAAKQAASSTLQSLPAAEAPQPVSIISKRDVKHEKLSSSVKESQTGLGTVGKLPRLAQRLRAIKEKPGSDFFVSVELDPPKGAVAKKLLAAAQLLHDAGADAINVGDSPMARVRMSSMATCQLIGTKVGIDTIIHFTTRDRNLMGIQADLLGCQALGVENILALTGDPPALGNYAHATAVYDVDSIGLIGIINQLNNGQDIARNSVGSPTNLSIACALNPTHEDRKLELERCRKKLEAGAHFIMTQPIYELRDLTDFLEEFGEVKVPILVGIMPLNSFKHAEYLHNEVPGITIPAPIRAAMQKAGDDGARVGLQLAEELLDQLGHICQGTYLVPSFGRYDDMATLVKRIKSKVEKTPAPVS